MIEMTKTIVRRLPQGIVAEIGPEGIALRRVRGRRRLRVTWEQIASLAGTQQNETLCRVAEHAGGERFITQLAALTTTHSPLPTAKPCKPSPSANPTPA